MIIYVNSEGPLRMGQGVKGERRWGGGLGQGGGARAWVKGLAGGCTS